MRRRRPRASAPPQAGWRRGSPPRRPWSASPCGCFDVEGGAAGSPPARASADRGPAHLEHVGAPRGVGEETPSAISDRARDGCTTSWPRPAPGRRPASGRLIASFMLAPAPTGPTCSTRRQIRSRIGRARSTSRPPRRPPARSAFPSGPGPRAADRAFDEGPAAHRARAWPARFPSPAGRCSSPARACPRDPPRAIRLAAVHRLERGRVGQARDDRASASPARRGRAFGSAPRRLARRGASLVRRRFHTGSSCPTPASARPSRRPSGRARPSRSANVHSPCVLPAGWPARRAAPRAGPDARRSPGQSPGQSPGRMAGAMAAG